MYILWNILTFCALAACPTFSYVRRFFFEAEHSCSRNSDLEGAMGFASKKSLSFQACFACSPLVRCYMVLDIFFLSRFEEGVFQLQKLEILERSLSKKSTTQQVWQPADFFRVDSQDLHVYHFWPSDPFCCGDFITLHVLRINSQKVVGSGNCTKKHGFGVIWGWYPCWVAGPDIFHFWISSCNLMSSGLGKEWGLISQCLSGFLAFVFFIQNQMACKKKGLLGIHHKIQDSQQKVRTYPLGSRFAGHIPPNERNPFIACVLEQTIKPKHEVSGSQHDNTMFFLGTEAPMVAALGRCGSLRDTCAAIHLSNKKRSWESHLITQNNKEGLLEACF